MFLLIAGCGYLMLGLVVALGMARAAQSSDVCLEIHAAGRRSTAGALAATSPSPAVPRPSRRSPALSA